MRQVGKKIGCHRKILALKAVWHLITRNKDGSALLGPKWAGPLLVGATVVSVV